MGGVKGQEGDKHLASGDFPTIENWDPDHAEEILTFHKVLTFPHSTENMDWFSPHSMRVILFNGDSYYDLPEVLTLDFFLVEVNNLV